MSAELQALIGAPASPPAPIEQGLPELTKALQRCTPRHRQVLRSLAINDFVPRRVAEALSVSVQFVNSTLRRPEVRAARELLESMAAETVGVTAASVLARLNSVVEEAVDFGDRTNALRGLSMLAQATGATPGRSGGGADVKVGVQVLVPVEERYSSLADAGVKVIDAEFSEVKS